MTNLIFPFLYLISYSLIGIGLILGAFSIWGGFKLLDEIFPKPPKNQIELKPLPEPTDMRWPE